MLPGPPPERLRDSIADASICTCALGLQSRDIALADRVRYHVNVYWENAPDHRASRTLDWLNDACEAKLKKKDRDQGRVKYAALMSPASITFISRGASLSFDWKRPFMQANRAKLRLGKGKYVRGFPISLLLTTKLNTTDAHGKAQQIQPYVLLGTKKRLGMRAAVSKYELADVRCGPVRRMAMDTPCDPVRREADHFQCCLYTSTVALDVRFATEFEATALFECLKRKSEPGQAAAKSGP